MVLKNVVTNAAVVTATVMKMTVASVVAVI